MFKSQIELRLKINMERYRSGHNEAVLKTVWGKPHMGSNPILSARWREFEHPKEFKFRANFSAKKNRDGQQPVPNFLIEGFEKEGGAKHGSKTLRAEFCADEGV